MQFGEPSVVFITREVSMARIRGDVKSPEDKQEEWQHAFDPEPVATQQVEEVTPEEFKWQHRYGNKNPDGHTGHTLRDSKWNWKK
jgi:hypothetical protein